MLIGFSLILYFWSKKIFIWKTGLIIGIIVVSFNKQYFGLINESPILKKKTETFEKEIIGKLIDGSLTEIKKFFILSESFIDQNQFAKFFSYLYEDNNSIIRYSDISISTEKISLIKKKIIDRFYTEHEKIISQELNINIINEVQYPNYTIYVFQWNAINGNKAVGNIYVPKNVDTKLPMVFSVPGCGENLWSDHPDQTNPQHRLSLLASNNIVSATTVAFCSNSEFTTNNRHEIISKISDGKLYEGEISLIIWLRFLRIIDEFKFIQIDKKKIGITGYSNGASIIKELMQVTDKINYISLVGTTISPSNQNEKVYNFASERIIETENENFYYGSGVRNLYNIIYKTLSEYNVTYSNYINNLLIFYFDKNFQIIIGKKDDAVNINYKPYLKDEIFKINKFNKLITGKANISLVENELDHNFSNENNIQSLKYFAKEFGIKNKLNFFTEYKKNDKKNLYPEPHFLNLKKLYLDEFKRKIILDNNIDKKEIYNLFNINNLGYNKPILLLSKEISIGDNKITAKFYAQKIFNELHGYFYEFENNKNNISNEKKIFIYSKTNYDLDLLFKSIDSNRITYLTILPGYGILNSRFTTTGNLAKLLMDSPKVPTLAGLGLKSIENLIQFSENNHKNIAYQILSTGVESNFLTTIHQIISKKASKIQLYENIDIGEFFNEKNSLSIPSIFFIKNFNLIYNELINLDFTNLKIEVISFGSQDNYIVNN